MDDELEQALQLDVLMNLLKADHDQSAEMIEVLANMLESSLPTRTRVVRNGWFMSKKKSVQDLTIEFEETSFQITKTKHGSVTAKQQKIVRGITLKNSDISMENCISEIVRELCSLAEKNAEARKALNRFVSGD